MLPGANGANRKPVLLLRFRQGASQPLFPASLRLHQTDVLTAPELAGKLSIPVNWLYVQIRRGRLLVDRQPSGAYLFNDTTTVLDGIQSLRTHKIGRLDLRIYQPHQEGH